MKLTDWLRRAFVTRIVVEERIYSPMTPMQKVAFDRAFDKMDEAFAELDKVFKP